MRCLGNNLNLNVNEISVSYNDNGPDDAPVLIFVHGFPFNKSMWKMQVRALKENYRVIAYDIRGHGNTESGKEKFSIELFAGDLIALMDKLEIDRAILCGLSMGGYIALTAVENYPERFDALVLSDTQCIADSANAKEKRLKTIEIIKEKGINNYAATSIKNLFAPDSFNTKKNEIENVREMIVKTSPQSVCNTLLALTERKETCSSLKNINIPVLVMAGKEDKIIPVDAAMLIHENIKDSLLRIIAHAGHVANIENPEAFNFNLVKFVDLVSKKAFCLSDTDGN